MLKIWFIKYSELLYKYCSYQRGKCQKHREAINSFLKFILSLLGVLMGKETAQSRRLACQKLLSLF
jgi:hypothetical protein